MSAIEIMKDFFFIERGLLNGNHFVFRSENPVLIDTGYSSDFNKTETLIKTLGVDLSRTSLIVNTHTHCDHIGGNKIIQDLSGCDIALHRMGKYFMDTRDGWSTWWKYCGQDAEFFDCTRALEDGDGITIGCHDFEVIYTPGHASDGIVLYNRKHKILISSDTLWEYELPAIVVRVEGSTAGHALGESLEKLAALRVDVVYPGHGSPFGDFKGALSRTKEKLKGVLYHKERIGDDFLKKLTVYTVLMNKSVPEDSFLSMLMGTHWFQETVDHYFDGDYEGKYHDMIKDFVHRGLFIRRGGRLYTTVKP